ncbi:MAG TPA: aminotransferase class V-fold PLP-dependent enzyme, partial [Deltaproteobacteria bacterium]|nr:aminotransferase class V-fold PLP-dependent enzyme [Deltaproteobacteria bacterium]
MDRPIYLDYNATTPLAPEVIEEMIPFMKEHFGNPSSSHYYGREPKKAIEVARERVAKLLNCSPEEIIFTSGGTESNNHALRGIAESYREKGNHIITTAIEHHAIIEPCL